MKQQSRTLAAGAVIASMLAMSPAFADSDKHGPASSSHQAIHQSMHGDGASSMMGGSMMGGSMMGNHQAIHARMHGANGSGDGDCPLGAAAERNLSADDVRNILEGQLAWRGNKRLKVGKVAKSGDETYVAEIVTVDDSLVQRLEVNRNTGAMRRIR